MNINELLDTIEDALEEGANVPLSGGKKIVNAEQIRDYLDEIRENLPGELRPAQKPCADALHAAFRSRGSPCIQLFFLAFWRRFARTFLTCAAFSAIVSSVFLSILSQ